jgi:hypothetical protein
MLREAKRAEYGPFSFTDARGVSIVTSYASSMMGLLMGKNEKRAARPEFPCLLAEQAGFEPAEGY